MIQTPSDRNYACFSCSSSETKDISSTCEKCDSNYDIGPSLEGTVLNGYTLEEYKGRGYYGLTFKCRNNINKEFAIKLIPKKLYAIRDKDFEAEITKYSSLGDHSNIVELITANTGSVKLNGNEIEVYFIVMKWIEGVTLRSFYENKDVKPSDLFSICTDIASGLARFESADLIHNDLNAENIMIEIVSEDDRANHLVESIYRAQIIDTGSAVFTTAGKAKKISDLNYLGQHTIAISNKVMAADPKPSLSDQYFIENLQVLASHLLDEDTGRGISNPSLFMERLQQIYEDKNDINLDEEEALGTPFGYMNASDFKPNSQLVSRLFSDDFPWIKDKIMPTSQPMLVTGPRGCGKTMILKNMRLRTKLMGFQGEISEDILKTALNDDDYLGFFVSARSTFGNHMLFNKIPKWAESETKVLAYFQLLYSVEILETVNLIKNRFKLEFDLSKEIRLCKLVAETIDCHPTSLSTTISDVKNILMKLRKEEFNLRMDSNIFVSEFLKSLSEAVVELHSAFHGKKVLFLLDDFSAPKIPASIQKILLPLIWAPGGGYFFKVSAHSMSTESLDSRGVMYEPNREFIEVKLGHEYIKFASNKEGKQRAEKTVGDIIQTRYRVSNNDNDQEIEFKKLFGDEMDIANEIKNKAKAKKLRTLNYRGWGTIISLCSGEISYVLELVQELFPHPDKEFPTKPIKITDQNRAIKDKAKEALLKLGSPFASELDLKQIASAFGKMSKAKLIGSSSDKDKEPQEYTRVEVELKEENADAQNGINELLRNGVFIDGGLSNSSSGVTARRLIFRKLFTPAFPTTWNNRNGFNWTQKRFVEFIKDPEGFEKKWSPKENTEITGELF